MEEINKVLSNPIVKQGLMVVAPEIALGIDLIMMVSSTLFSSKLSAEQLLVAIDTRLAKILEDLATTESKRFRRECEVRAHELLGILNEWEKIT